MNMSDADGETQLKDDRYRISPSSEGLDPYDYLDLKGLHLRNVGLWWGRSLILPLLMMFTLVGYVMLRLKVKGEMRDAAAAKQV
jgi:hypothetical protein